MTDKDHFGRFPDYLANEANDQEPVLSNIGRGPEGAGLEITDVDSRSSDGTFTFKIREDKFGQVLLQTPNLHSGVWSIQQNTDDLASFILKRDGATVFTKDVRLPRGASGARFCVALPVVDWPLPAIRPEDYDYEEKLSPLVDYRFSVDRIQYSGLPKDGHSDFEAQRKPPQIGDLVLMTYRDRTNPEYPRFGWIIGYVNDISYVGDWKSSELEPDSTSGVEEINKVEDGYANNLDTGFYQNRMVAENGIHVIAMKCMPFITDELLDIIDKKIQQALTSALRFKGYISVAAPNPTAQWLKLGQYWYQSDTQTAGPENHAPDTGLPWAVKVWNGSSWIEPQPYPGVGNELIDTGGYVPSSLDLWSDLNTDEGWYWFGGHWQRNDLYVDGVTIGVVDGKIQVIKVPAELVWVTNDDDSEISLPAVLDAINAAILREIEERTEADALLLPKEWVGLGESDEYEPSEDNKVPTAKDIDDLKDDVENTYVPKSWTDADENAPGIDNHLVADSALQAALSALEEATAENYVPIAWTGLGSTQASEDNKLLTAADAPSLGTVKRVDYIEPSLDEDDADEYQNVKLTHFEFDTLEDAEDALASLPDYARIIVDMVDDGTGGGGGVSGDYVPIRVWEGGVEGGNVSVIEHEFSSLLMESSGDDKSYSLKLSQDDPGVEFRLDSSVNGVDKLTETLMSPEETTTNISYTDEERTGLVTSKVSPFTFKIRSELSQETADPQYKKNFDWYIELPGDENLFEFDVSQVITQGGEETAEKFSLTAEGISSEIERESADEPSGHANLDYDPESEIMSLSIDKAPLTGDAAKVSLSLDTGDTYLEPGSPDIPQVRARLGWLGQERDIDITNHLWYAEQYPPNIDTSEYILIYTNSLATAGPEKLSYKKKAATDIPAPPTADGTYVLRCVVTSGVPAYNWEEVV